MITFTLKRLESDALTTRGELLDTAGVRLSATLELAWHPMKLAGRTRIPAGSYKLGFRTASHFDLVYRERLQHAGQTYRGMIEILDVPDYVAVLLHCGNTRLDTKACVLVGDTVAKQGDQFIIPGGSSVPAFLRVYAALAHAIGNGGAELGVQDLDRA